MSVTRAARAENISEKCDSDEICSVMPPQSPRLSPEPQPPPPPRLDETGFGDNVGCGPIQIEESAVKVEGVWKAYHKDCPVLKSVNMNIPKGSIYALLGSSGCGKTTMLSCVVGRQTWDSGRISILGSAPYSKRCIIDSKKIGYMPQDLALHPLLTIREILELYGRLFAMSSEDIQERLKFLQNFLQLPKEQKVIKNLSGGQQRRASLAVALLHEPDLIILDEPTVGLDPLLRQSIWEHLQDLVTNLQVTIVLTTHYVDEARRSHMIGLMRHGRIIAEEPPNCLMEKYNTTSLDTIVLVICRRDAESKNSRKSSPITKGHQMTEVVSSTPSIMFEAKGKLGKVFGEQQIVANDEANGSVTFLKYKNTDFGANLDGPMDHNSFTTSFTKGIMGSVKSKRKCVSSTFATIRRIKGLIWAVYLLSFRHPAFIPLTFILPAVTSALVQFVFGSPLHDLKFGYVNNDDDPFNNLTRFVSSNESKANCFQSEEKLSHLFLNKIPPDSLTLISFDSKSDAVKAVEAGEVWGYLNIPTNYTTYMKERMLANLFSDNETLDGTTIGMHLDMSNYLGSILIIKQLYQSYEAFIKDLARSCNLAPEEFEIPLNFKSSVFGKGSGSYAEQVVPGLIFVLIFTLPCGALSISVIQERRQKTLDRMKVAGMRGSDMIITYLFTHGSFQIVQMTLCTLVLILGFSYVIKGPILLYILVNCCNAFCGLAIGFAIGLVCGTELQAMIVVFFIVAFILPFSGTFWPMEVLAQHWRIFSYLFPTTLTSRAFRSVLFRGLSITHGLVWPGVVFPLIWMFIFLIVDAIAINRF